MSNKIFEQLLLEEIEIFKNSFSKVSKAIFTSNKKNLIHPGEFGMYRESIARKFLKSFTPANFEIDQGFLINSNNEVSTQCDIIVFNPKYTPLLKNQELQRFFPVETVGSVGEVKSILNFSDFKNALHKLAKTKKMSEYVKSSNIIYRNEAGNFSPKKYPHDLISTFIICQKLDFDIKRIVEVYDNNIEVRHRHNMILSLDDGLILYELSTNGETGVHYLPTIDGVTQLNFGHQNFDKGDDRYIKVFCNYLFQALTFRTILSTQISDYMVYP